MRLLVLASLFASRHTINNRHIYASCDFFFAERDEKHSISRKFFYGFGERNKEDICERFGKIILPMRNYRQMLAKTKEFISSFEYVMTEKNITEKNIVVFDESIIGDSAFLPKVVTERRNSGGGNGNVGVSRRKALGSIIPFSMGDGSTPFRVFIFKTGKSKKSGIPFTALTLNHEKWTPGAPHRLFFANETGYLTKEIFAVIMDEFIKWWTATRPGLHCFMISDNLSIHRDNAIVSHARSMGIHMINIMPGSSHWFQVHDQLPFANLKKMMLQKKKEILRGITLTSEERRKILMGIFYEAE